MHRYDVDIAIIGGGAAGIAAAKLAAQEGMNVALVEKKKLGGSEINTRDVPYGASFHFSHLYSRAVYGARFGISSGALRFNYPTVSHWRERVVNRTAAGIRKELEEMGVKCFRGKAMFTGAHEIAIGRESRLTARKFLIAVGSEMKDPGIAGLGMIPVLTAEDVLNVERPPKTIMVIGGGATGVELAQYFSELGSKVAIAEIAERLLPREDEEVGQVIEQYLDKKFGVKILTQSRVIAIERDAISPKVIYLRDGHEKMVRVESIVLATGTQPTLDLGLENAGVKLTRKGGLKVDHTLQTSVKNIYAAGDVLGGDGSSTEKAIYEAGIAVKNMLKRSKSYVNYSGFIRLVDTDPQIAVVGLTEDDLVKRAKKYTSVVVPLSETQASNTQDFRMGFIKMLASKDGKILGATVMAPGAAEIIQELAVMVRHNFSIMEIASTPHVAGSFSNLVLIAAQELVKKR